EAAAEVLLSDDVGGRLRPDLGELDAALLEDGFVAPWNVGVADLPFDLVERVAPGDGEVAAHADGRAVVQDDVPDLVLGRRVGVRRLFCARHAAASRVSVECPLKGGPGRVESVPDGARTGARSARAAAAREPERPARGAPGCG